MSRYTLTYSTRNINFHPTDTLEEIYQNITTILSTYKFTVPLFREFGFDAEFIDKPMSLLQPLYFKEVIETIEKYEPRVIVEEIKLTAELDGIAYPIIIFILRDGVEL